MRLQTVMGLGMAALLAACHGDCEVSCPGSGECIVRCDPGAECVLDRCESPVTCPDGVAVCNGGCPG